PNADFTAFRAIGIQTGNVTPVINWGVQNTVTDCGQQAVVVSNSATNGEVDIYYRSRVSAPVLLSHQGVPPAGNIAQDRFAFAMGNRIIVLNTTAGQVWAHDVAGNNVSAPVLLSHQGVPPAGNIAQDRFAFAMGNRIIVLNTTAGQVWAHDVAGNNVSAPVLL